MGKVWSINNNFGENKKIKENYIFILSFILPMVIMFVVFTSLGVGFIGDKTIVSSDMYTQYVAYFGKFKDILSGDGSIFYSFNKSIGGNNIGLFAYYLASPLNLLLILFKSFKISLSVYSFKEVKMLSSPSINLSPSHLGLIEGIISFKSSLMEFIMFSISSS